MSIDEYNEAVKGLVEDLEKAVANYDALIKNSKSKDVSEMLISNRQEIIYYYTARINGLHAGFIPQEETID